MKRDIQEFTVEGVGQFPFDMLRYDSCWPYMANDAAELESRAWQRETNSQRRRVVLQGLNHPTPDRWASFNWRVIGLGAQRS